MAIVYVVSEARHDGRCAFSYMFYFIGRVVSASFVGCFLLRKEVKGGRMRSGRFLQQVTPPCPSELHWKEDGS